MGKTLTAAQMLSAGRKRPPTPAETGTELLDHQTSTNLDAQTTEPLGARLVERVKADPTVRHDNQLSKRLSAQSEPTSQPPATYQRAVSYTHLRAHETDSYLVCRLLLE